MASRTMSERRNYYVGETANQLRNGFGVYYYANNFFRYEGDWVKGKKHGHGKLVMADGSYYEGEFKNGEIEGHGFRKWQSSGNTYSGEFSKGEMHGHGVMNYADGSQFQGEFIHNQRHGTGILRDRDGNEYEGSWYENKKHGQGIQTFANGDEYEGDWVEGCRHGHGELNCVDGTVYEGQWRADMFNGQGRMVHASGTMYEGLWINGKPEQTAHEVQVVLPAGQKFIEVVQGRKFDVQLQVVDANQEPVLGEQGREFHVIAGYRFSSKTGQTQSLLELIEDIEAKPIATPFGYEVLPYPLAEVVYDEEYSAEGSPRRKQRASPVNSRVLVDETIHETNETASESHRGEEQPNPDQTDDADVTSSISESKYATSDTQLDLSTETAEDDAEINITHACPPPAAQRSSVEGKFEFNSLLLPAAPSNYRPYAQDGEMGPDGKVATSPSTTPTSSMTSLRRGAGSSSSIRSEKIRRKGSRTASAASSSGTSIEGKPGKGARSKANSDDRGAKPGKRVRRKSIDNKSGKVSAKRGSFSFKKNPTEDEDSEETDKHPDRLSFEVKRGRKKSVDVRSGKQKRSSETDPKKDGLLCFMLDTDDDNDSLRRMSERTSSVFAAEGEYVLIIEEVTQPPFLDARLEPAFVLVKVKPLKTTAKKTTSKRAT